MATKKQYEQVKKDYNYMVKEWGSPSDLTGGFVEGDHYFDLLDKPTLTNAYQNYRDLIDYGFQTSGDYIWCSDDNSGNDKYINISGDPVAVEIYDRNC